MSRWLRSRSWSAVLSVSCALPAITLSARTIAGQALRTINGPIDWLREELDGARAVAELRDGSVVLSESRGKRVLLIDWSNHRVKQLGRIGDGPGEYRAVGDIFPINNDTLLIIDPQARRMLTYAHGNLTSGHFSSSALAVMLSGRILGADDRGRLAMLRKGRVSPDVRRQLGPIAGTDYADSNWLVLASISSQTMDTVSSLKGRMQGLQLTSRVVNGVMYFLYDPFASPDQAVLFRDGWLAVVRSTPYRVDWCLPDGRWIKGPLLPHGATVITEADKRLALRREFGTGPITPEMIPSWPRTLPAYTESSLLATAEGLLVIPRTVSSAPAGGPVYDVIRRDGTKQLSVRLSPSERILGFGKNTVFIVRIDDDGVERLGRASWHMD